MSAEAEHLLVSECVLFEMKSGCLLVPSCEILGREDLTQIYFAKSFVQEINYEKKNSRYS